MKRRAACLVAIVLLVSTLVLSSRRAFANEEPEALISQGVEMRRRGDDVRAHGYFKRAYQIAHTARAAAQLGLVEQALGYFLEADQHLGEALDNPDAWVDQNRPLLQKSRASLRQLIGKVVLRGLPAAATVEVAGRPVMLVPSDGAVWALPGVVSLIVSAPDHGAVNKQVRVAAGETVTLNIELPSTKPTQAAAAADPPRVERLPDKAPVAVAAAPAEQTADDGRSGRRIAGIITAGAGVAVGVTGVFVYRAGATKLENWMRDAEAGRPYDSANSNYKSLGRLGIGLMVGGGAALLTGTLLYLLNREGSNEPSGSNVSVAYLPGQTTFIQIGRRFR